MPLWGEQGEPLPPLASQHDIFLPEINLEFQETDVYPGNRDTEANHIAGPLPNPEASDLSDTPEETAAVPPDPIAELSQPRHSQRISQPSHKFLTGLMLDSGSDEE